VDRIDLRCVVGPVTRAAIAADGERRDTTATVAARVAAARDRQRARFVDHPFAANGLADPAVLRREWPLDAGAVAVIGELTARGAVTARGADRILRVAWTLADLAGRARPGIEDVREAAAYHLGLGPLGMAA
jgi:magnesium chelatase family protein